MTIKGQWGLGRQWKVVSITVNPNHILFLQSAVGTGYHEQGALAWIAFDTNDACFYLMDEVEVSKVRRLLEQMANNTLASDRSAEYSNVYLATKGL